MKGSTLDRINEALDELDQYLADTIPPLLVADSLRLLMRCPPELVAERLILHSPQTGVRREDRSYDGVMKSLSRLRQTADLGLIPQPDMARFLSNLGPALLASCPADSRSALEALLGDLSAGGEAARRPTAMPTNVDAADSLRPERTPYEPADVFTRRLIPLIRRLAEGVETVRGASGLQPGVVSQEITSQLLAAAVCTASSAGELEERLERLKAFGVHTDVRAVLRTLGRSLPNWSLVLPEEGYDASRRGASPYLSADTRLQAMHRLVGLGGNLQDNLTRFHQMMETAIEQFNSGWLGRAAAIGDLARSLVSSEIVPPSGARQIWEKTREMVSTERLVQCVSDPVQQALLHRFLSCFPAFSTGNLLGQLENKSGRLPRGLVLSLLKTGGQETRVEVVKGIEKSIPKLSGDDSPAWEYIRSLLSLLSSLPTSDNVSANREMEILQQLARLPLPLAAFRELVRHLTRVQHDKLIDLLVDLLKQASRRLEQLSREGHPAAEAAEWTTLLESVLIRLSEFSTRQTLRLVLDYCVPGGRMSGLSYAPLANLGRQDLSPHKDVVARLVAAVTEQLPSGFRAILLKPPDRPLLDLVRALSGTPTEEVKGCFRELAERFPTRSFGLAAAHALHSFDGGTAAGQEAAPPAPTVVQIRPDAAPEPGAQPEGDRSGCRTVQEGTLELFDLPTLIQHLAASSSSGFVRLTSRSGDPVGSIQLEKGQILDCRSGRLVGREAFYLLLEKPVPGRFAVIMAPAPSGESQPEAQETIPLLPTLKEGMRRYDEYRCACLIVPDDSILSASGGEPTAPEDEDDEALLKETWNHVVGGASALECEQRIETDPYRVRRLIAHWLCEGSLHEVRRGTAVAGGGHRQAASPLPGGLFTQRA